MSFDLYAIKHENWQKYEYNIISILDKIEDNWYIYKIILPKELNLNKCYTNCI
jgi:hypothetical protein